MKYEIVELELFTGSKTSVYSILLQGDELTLFDHFIEENQNDFETEVRSIVNRIKEIGCSTGAREQFFKTKEGLPGDGVCALYDEPGSNLRLYCIRYGSVAIILGGGGLKGRDIIAWQDDEKLSQEAKRMIKVSKDIMQRLRDGELKWSTNGSELVGDLNFTDHEDE